MKIIYNPKEIYAQLDFARRQGQSIGLIPTMGALHDGHLSLVTMAKAACDLAAVTIFVNPTQFGPNEDFQRYPRTLEEDVAKLNSVGADYVFVPSVDDMYPPGFSTYVQPPKIAERFEGEFRPGHFRGVATVVAKLFMMVPATAAFFGRKDYQQLQVIRHVVQDLAIPIRIQDCPTLREPDGLAMSSRNRYLNPEERQRAVGIWSALSQIADSVQHGNRDIISLEQLLRQCLLSAGIEKIDYARVVDADSLQDLQELNGPAVALIAARVGQTRLIDNLLLTDV